MYAVTEVTNEQYKEPTDSRLFEVWESGLAKPPSVAIPALHLEHPAPATVQNAEDAETAALKRRKTSATATLTSSCISPGMTTRKSFFKTSSNASA